MTVTVRVLATVDQPFDTCPFGHSIEDDRLGCVICYAHRKREHLALARAALDRLIYERMEAA